MEAVLRNKLIKEPKIARGRVDRVAAMRMTRVTAIGGILAGVLLLTLCGIGRSRSKPRLLDLAGKTYHDRLICRYDKDLVPHKADPLTDRNIGRCIPLWTRTYNNIFEIVSSSMNFIYIVFS